MVFEQEGLSGRWTCEWFMAADNILVEGGECLRSMVPAIFDDQFIREVGSYPQCSERGPKAGFVFKRQIVDGG